MTWDYIERNFDKLGCPFLTLATLREGLAAGEMFVRSVVSRGDESGFILYGKEGSSLHLHGLYLEKSISWGELFETLSSVAKGMRCTTIQFDTSRPGWVRALRDLGQVSRYRMEFEA